MITSYATRNPVIRLAVNGAMAAETCESLALIGDQATTATVQKPQKEGTDQSFAALDE